MNKRNEQQKAEGFALLTVDKTEADVARLRIFSKPLEQDKSFPCSGQYCHTSPTPITASKYQGIGIEIKDVKKLSQCDVNNSRHGPGKKTFSSCAQA
jgi:hypothetical protein